MAQDGDTAQVPVSLAQLLNVVDVTNVFDVIKADKNSAIVKQRLNDRINILEAKTPCLIAVKEECQFKFTPKINDYVRAQNKGIEEYCFEDLDLTKNDVGIIGSPTMVYKAFRPVNEKNAVPVKENYSNFILDMVSKGKIR
jgi:electron transfer flavoprotein beta subunit